MGRLIVWLYERKTVDCCCKKCDKTVVAKKKPPMYLLYVIWVAMLMTAVFALFGVLLPYGVLIVLLVLAYGSIFYFVFPYSCTECHSTLMYTKKVR